MRSFWRSCNISHLVLPTRYLVGLPVAISRLHFSMTPPAKTPANVLPLPLQAVFHLLHRNGFGSCPDSMSCVNSRILWNGLRSAPIAYMQHLTTVILQQRSQRHIWLWSTLVRQICTWKKLMPCERASLEALTSEILDSAPIVMKKMPTAWSTLCIEIWTLRMELQRRCQAGSMQ